MDLCCVCLSLYGYVQDLAPNSTAEPLRRRYLAATREEGAGATREEGAGSVGVGAVGVPAALAGVLVVWVSAVRRGLSRWECLREHSVLGGNVAGACCTLKSR